MALELGVFTAIGRARIDAVEMAGRHHRDFLLLEELEQLPSPQVRSALPCRPPKASLFNCPAGARVPAGSCEEGNEPSGQERRRRKKPNALNGQRAAFGFSQLAEKCGRWDAITADIDTSQSFIRNRRFSDFHFRARRRTGRLAAGVSRQGEHHGLQGRDRRRRRGNVGREMLGIPRRGAASRRKNVVALGVGGAASAPRSPSATRRLKVKVLDDYDFLRHRHRAALRRRQGRQEWAPKIAAKGCIVIDNSSAWRYDSDVPLIVPR